LAKSRVYGKECINIVSYLDLTDEKTTTIIIGSARISTGR